MADPRGFATLAEDLASSVFAEDDPRLKLCTRVTRIERAVQGGLLVTTDDGQVRRAADRALSRARLTRLTTAR